MEIRSSLPAVHARRQMNIANEKLQKASERLASGYRVNSAADDTAGLAVSEKLRSQMKGLQQASRNCQDGINLVQTFEGALNETDSILQRCKELAAESANGEYNDPVDRKALQSEYDQLVEEINQISDTDFNGVFMLNGNPTIRYVDMEVETPVVNNSFEPVFDENGDPVLDAESYRVGADFSGSPFGVNGMFAPRYSVAGAHSDVCTEYGNGDKGFFDIDVCGTYTGEDGTPRTITLSLMSPNNDIVESYRSDNGTDENDNRYYTYSRTVTKPNDPVVKLNIVSKAVEKVTYLTNRSGAEILDADGERIPISKQWEMSYEISLADGTDPQFTLNNINFDYRADTYWNGDEKERYYTSDVSRGALDRETIYTKPFEIDSFSCYYFDQSDPTFNKVSNKINLDMGDNGPDKVKLGLYTNRNYLTTNRIDEGDDLNYVQYWVNRAPVNGVITLNAGSRGMANSTGDTNIWPKPEIDYITEIVTNAVTKYNDDVDLVIQTGTRTKDSVQFTFEYELRDTGDLKSDLNCSSAGLGVDRLTIGTQTDANSAIDMIDHAINKVSMVRAGFGAAQNRLAHKINDLTNTNENITAAESGIRDADMATEYSDYTKAQIVSNAAQSIMSQTMQLPRSILSLIS